MKSGDPTFPEAPEMLSTLLFTLLAGNCGSGKPDRRNCQNRVVAKIELWEFCKITQLPDFPITQFS